MIFYILNAALILTGCFVFYKLLLQKETFFPLNRLVLIACLALSFGLPLVPIPAKLSLRTDQSPVETVAMKPIPVMTETPVTPALTPAIVKPWYDEIPFRKILIWGYWTGVLIFGINFLIQLITLLYRAYSSPVIRDGKFRIVEISGDKAPCSFGNNIFINPEKYEWETYSQILLHEKVHIEQGHSYDILLAEIALVFQWFNPFAWMYRKAIENNLEFLTDNELLEKKEVEPKSYQLSLVKVSAPHFPLTLTTNYNQSILKKRLIMMNAKKSTISTAWKYLFIFPLLLVFACLLNEPIAKAGTNKSPLVAMGEIATEGYWFGTIKKDKVEMKFDASKDGEGHNNATFLLTELTELPKNQNGDFTLTRDAGTLRFHGKFEGEIGMGRYTFTPNKSYFTTLQKENIELESDNEQFVFFLVNVKSNYIAMLKSQGFKNIQKSDLIPLVALKVDGDYIKSLKEAGYNDLTLRNLIPLKSLHVDAAYINELKHATSARISIDRLISMKAQGITAKFLKDNAEARNVESEFSKDLATKISKTVQKEMDMNLRDDKGPKGPKGPKGDKGEKDEYDEMGQLLAKRILGVTAEYLKGFEAIGYKLDNETQFSFKALGITPDFVKSIEQAGFPNPDIDDITGAKALGLTSEKINAYRKLPLKHLTLSDIMGAYASGTTPEYISALRKKGYNYDDLGTYISKRAQLFLTGEN